MTVDREVPWQFEANPADLLGEVSDGKLADYEAELAVDLEDAVAQPRRGRARRLADLDHGRGARAVAGGGQFRPLAAQHTYVLPLTVVPPLSHRHPKLVWELSALHMHRQACYEPGGSDSEPIT